VGCIEALNYAKYRFEYFPSEYFKVLQSLCFPTQRRIRVLDIGCGPGNWTIAVASYNQEAEVIGIDRNKDSLQVAELYRNRFRCNNVSFLRLKYRDIDARFEAESFDYVLSMSVLMYLDENGYFKSVSRVLKSGGRLLLFWNHAIGYYIQKICSELRRKNAKGATRELRSIMIGLPADRLLGGDHEHPVYYWRAKRIAARYGIGLEVKGFSPLCSSYYDRTFGRVPNVFNMIGEKSATHHDSS
jgi:SAM-dependent methyltransferase